MSAILVEGLSKRYEIGHEQRSDTLRDAVTHGVKGLWQALCAGHLAHTTEEFWALRDVSFKVEPGEAIGIIGRNGAGKSTLLKILSRITEPTQGEVRIRGRAASLLEVGTGFHPELTGRENIFLNGAILGMSRAEIRGKFDEIVAFAEIERFLDTPVKRYSSGMYVRLAFAVAAHLEPEILIVDEVLAVGDAAFQKKCLGKMESVSRHAGRTVLFVSHNLGVVQSLCQRCVLLDRGRVIYAGPSHAAITAYSRIGLDIGTTDFGGTDPAVRVDRAEVVQGHTGLSLEVDLTIRSSRRRSFAVELLLSATTGVPIALAAAGTFDPNRLVTCETGETRLRWRVELGRIANGSYFVAAQLVEPTVQVYARHDYPVIVEIHRTPQAPDIRVLDQQWQAGCVELELHPR